MRLFRLEAERGNALAMYDLGRMWADGLGVEADPDTAQEWYRKEKRRTCSTMSLRNGKITIK